MQSKDYIQSQLTARLQRALILMLIACTHIGWAADATQEVIVEPAPVLTDPELQKLVSPVALYPDDLLAIVLPASTYPLQVVAATRFRTETSNDVQEPNENWDESIVALLNYPEVLALLNDDIDWTWELGQAVINQEEALMSAVQYVRNEALAAGNINTDDKQTVYVEDQAVVIKPVDEEVIYVPYYEPDDVIHQQATRVYHYYPTAYPTYYYPYESNHFFYDQPFWGVSSIFSLSWGHHHLRHYRHNHHGHRYHNRRYHDRHYRYTRHYRAPPAYYRRWSHRRAHDFAYNGHWRPKYRRHGARPYQYGNRHGGQANRHTGDRKKTTRHLNRRGGHHYAALDRKRAASRPQGRRHSVHRDTRRERKAVPRRPTAEGQRLAQKRTKAIKRETPKSTPPTTRRHQRTQPGQRMSPRGRPMTQPHARSRPRQAEVPKRQMRRGPSALQPPVAKAKPSRQTRARRPAPPAQPHHPAASPKVAQLRHRKSHPARATQQPRVENRRSPRSARNRPNQQSSRPARRGRGADRSSLNGGQTKSSRQYPPITIERAR